MFMTNTFNNVAKQLKVSMHKLLASALVTITTASAIVPLNVPSVQAQAVLDEWVVTSTPVQTELPVAGDREAPRTMKIPVTAYNSLPNQTDSTPFHTADNTHVRDGIVAANFLPLGTRVKFPELYGDKEFVIKDRMNRRYTYKADIWMEEYSDAIDFGLNYTTIEIYPVDVK